MNIYQSYPVYGMTHHQKSRFQIPQMPILGIPDFSKLIAHIYKAIVDEATAAEFYSRLLTETPDKLHREFVEHAYMDEMEHLEAFSKLYAYYTGQMPRYKITPVEYGSYKEGILMALKGELEAAEFYRDVKVSNTDPLVRDTFFYAMVDELEHATQFGVLYNTI